SPRMAPDPNRRCLMRSPFTYRGASWFSLEGRGAKGEVRRESVRSLFGVATRVERPTTLLSLLPSPFSLLTSRQPHVLPPANEVLRSSTSSGGISRRNRDGAPGRRSPPRRRDRAHDMIRAS